MQRRYIYILVFILTIGLVLVDHYYGLSKQKDNEVINKLDEVIDDEYNAATVNYSLIIKNFQNDDNEYLYTYRVKITDLNGAQLYTYKNTDNYMVFAANGEANFQVASNETLTIHNIPEGSIYEIEQVTDVSDKYTTKINSVETKVVTGTIGTSSIVEFANETIIPQTPTKPSKDGTEKPAPEEEEKDNPFTNDTHYLALIVFLYASVILFIAFKNKIKRFG